MIYLKLACDRPESKVADLTYLLGTARLALEYFEPLELAEGPRLVLGFRDGRQAERAAQLLRGNGYEPQPFRPPHGAASASRLG